MNSGKGMRLISIGIIILLFAAVSVLYVSVRDAEKRVLMLESLNKEMSGNSALLAAMSGETGKLRARAEEGRKRNFIPEFEKTSSEFGLAKNLKKINLVSQRQDGRFSAEDYEVVLEGVDINTAVNFIYRLTNSAGLIKIRKCSMTVSFENPGLLNISLLLSRLK